MKRTSLLFSISLLVVAGAYAAPKSLAQKECMDKCMEYAKRTGTTPEESKKTCPDCRSEQADESEEVSRGTDMNPTCRCGENCPCDTKDMPNRGCGCKKPKKSTAEHAAEEESA